MSGAQDRGIDGIELARGMFPELAVALDAALARNGAQDPDAALDRALDAGAAGLPSAGFGAGGAAGAESGESAPEEQRLLAAITAADRAFAAVGLRAPEPEAFVAAGIDPGALGAALRRDPGLVPVVAPHGLGTAGWRAAFHDAADAPGLLFASEIERDFALLDAPPAGEPAVRGEAADGTPIAWTLRAIPGTESPAVLGLSHAHGPHPSLGEMLALQLVRAAAQEPPVDRGAFTWLDPRIGGGRLAARHVYDAEEGAIRISAREIGSQGPHLGARPPVSG